MYLVNPAREPAPVALAKSVQERADLATVKCAMVPVSSFVTYAKVKNKLYVHSVKEAERE